MPPKRKPAAKKAATPAPVEQTPTQEDPKPEMPTESEVNAMIEDIFAPPASEEAIALAQMVRAHVGTRDVLFSPEQGITLMFGYSGLSRVMLAHRHVHIATVDELDTMSDQQMYDAVMEADKR